MTINKTDPNEGPKLALIGAGRQGQRYREPRNGGSAIAISFTRAPITRRDIPEIQGVIIATPAETHAELAMRWLEQGLGVLVEKPLATNWADCACVIDYAESKRLPLLVGHTHLSAEGWEPPPMPAGPLALMSYYGGPCRLPAWLDWGPHLVAMACSLFSGAPTRVNRYELNQWLLSFGSGDDLRMAHVGFGDRERYRNFEVWDRERVIWSYDAEAPSEHTPMWHQVETFKRMIAGEPDRRGSYDFTRKVYRIVFGEL